jgi:hypothetical protein
VNAEAVNDAAKLVMHRIVARRLAADPAILVRARDRLARMAERWPERSFVAEWAAILDMPPAVIRRRLTARDEDSIRLRLSSPFFGDEKGVDLADPALRRRIWRIGWRLATSAAERSA